MSALPLPRAAATRLQSPGRSRRGSALCVNCAEGTRHPVCQRPRLFDPITAILQRSRGACHFRSSARVLLCTLPARLSRCSEENPDLLDFGGGDADVAGRIANLLLEGGAAGVRIRIVGLQRRGSPVGFLGISLDRVESLEGVPEGSFDLVHCQCHPRDIPHPRRDLTSLLKALRPGGVIYARTPSVVPLLKMFRLFGLAIGIHVFRGTCTTWGEVSGARSRQLPLGGSIDVLDSRPALVETTLGIHPLRTIAAYLLKAPWRVLGSSYGLIGGWEVFFTRRGSP